MSTLNVTRSIFKSKHKQFDKLATLYWRGGSVAHCYTDDAPRPLKSLNLGSMKRGTGGRCSFNGIVATVFGCTGFLARYVCNKLGKIGTQLILPYRGDAYDPLRLKLCGDLGQVLFHYFDLKCPDTVYEAVKYSNVVINLIGREWNTKNFTLEDVHVNGAKMIAQISKQAGVNRLIHVSALNVTPEPKGHILKNGSNWLRTKYHGEMAVKEEFPEATIIRPSDIYGSEDRFLRYYAHIIRRQFRSVPLYKKGEKTVKQPVYVADVAQGIVNCIMQPETAGKVYQAIGPKRYLLSELVDWFHRLMRRDHKWWGYRRYDMSRDPTFMWKVALIQRISPNTPIGGLCPERVELECITDSPEKCVPTLEDLGVTLTEMEDQVPWELRPFRAALYYDADLNEFENPSPPNCLTEREESQIYI